MLGRGGRGGGVIDGLGNSLSSPSCSSVAASSEIGGVVD